MNKKQEQAFYTRGDTQSNVLPCENQRDSG